MSAPNEQITAHVPNIPAPHLVLWLRLYADDPQHSQAERDALRRAAQIISMDAYSRVAVAELAQIQPQETP